VLPPSVAVIQGDGITRHSLPRILSNLKEAGFAVDCLAFGMGGGLLQQVNRDTYKFAMKTSAISVNGVWRDVWKEAPGKPSKRGRFAVVRSGDRWVTMPEEGHSWENELARVWMDGEELRDQSFTDVRARAKEGLTT
jgi:nicotinamide phosphoribosyltransferase